MNGGSDLNVALRISGDASGASAAVDQTRAKFDQLGASAQRAMAAGRAATNDQTAAVAELIGKIDPLAGKFAQLDDQLSKLKAFKASGAISGEDFAEYAAKIETTRAALGGVTEGTHSFNLATSQARVELGRMAKDIATGQYGRLAQSTTTLAAQTGLLGRAFSMIASPVGIAVSIVGVLAGAYASAAAEEAKFDQALIQTGNYTGKTVDDLRAMRDEIASSSSDYSKAATALTSLAASGRITGDALQLAAQTAVDFSNVTGEKIEKSVHVIEQLAENPVQACAKLNQSFHFLTLAEYEHIAALQKSGDAEGAFTAASQALDAAMKQRAAQAQADAGLFSRAWTGALNAVAESWNGLKTLMGSIGNNSIQEQLIQAQTTLSTLENEVAQSKGALADAYASSIAAAKQRVAALQQEANAQQKLRDQQAQYQQVEAQGIAAQEQLTKFLDEHAQKSEKLSGDLVILQRMLVQVAAAAAATAAKENTFSGWMDAFSKLKQLASDATKGIADLNAQGRKVVDTSAQDQQILDKVLNDASNGWEKANQLAQQLATGMTGPYAAAQKVYNDGIATISAAYEDLNTQLNLGVISQDEYERKVNVLIDASEKLGEQEDKRIEQLKELQMLHLDEGDAVENLIAKYRDEEDALRNGTQQDVLLTAQLRAEDQMRRAIAKSIMDGHQYTQQQIDDLVAEAGQHGALIEKLKEEERAWDSLAGKIADSLAQALTSGGNILKNIGNALVNTMRELVNELIAQWLRTRIIGMFTGMSGGGMGGMASAAMGAMSTDAGSGSFGSSGSIIGSVAQSFAGGSSAAGGTGFELFSPSTWLTAGQNLWSGFTGGATAAGSTIFGTWSGSGSVLGGGIGQGVTTLNGQVLSGMGSGGTFVPSALGQGLGIAGGIYAGYNEYQAAGGGLGGLAGGAAYGVGTYAAGMGLMAGSAAMAGGATLGGAAAAGMAAIPVVGWIALAAMAINMISGGKLFGTAAKPIGGDLTETIGPDGATLTNILHEKGQKALFGGAYYKDKNLPVDQKAIDAANSFFDALKKGTSDFAAQFGTTMGNIVGGTFTQSYDKNGKPTTTTSVVNGVTYTGETGAQFQERIQSANYLAVLDKLGVGASAYVQGLQGDADALFKAVQDLAAASQAAYSDINRGMGLLGPDGNLGAVMTEVEKLAGGGEQLADAYSRLVQEQAAWKGSMEAEILTLGKSSAETLEFADSLAKAFGSAGAMQQALQTFDQNYYSAGQLAQIKIANDKTQLAQLGSLIGQDAGESMDQFKAAFTAVESSLTPDELAKWINFGNLLAQVTNETQSAAASYAQFMAQFGPTTSGFEQAMQKVQDSLAANVKQADSLAQANGQAGASAADLGKIISASVMQGVAAVQALEQEAGGLIQTLMGGGDLQSQIDKLNAQANAGNGVAAAQAMMLQKQLDAQNAAAAQQQQFMQAAQLLGDLGQIGAITGKGLGDFSKMFPSFSADKLASLLGTDQAGLAKEFDQQVKTAQAAIQTADNTKYSNELQADILAVLQGQAAPFSAADLYSALTGQAVASAAASTGTDGKPLPIGATGGPVADSTYLPTIIGNTGATSSPTTVDTTTAVQDGTKPVVDATKAASKDMVAVMRDVLAELRAMRNERGYQGFPRNTRPMTPYTVMTP